MPRPCLNAPFVGDRTVGLTRSIGCHLGDAARGDTTGRRTSKFLRFHVIANTALALRDRLLVELVAIVGLRPGEAVALRWTDVSFTEESATVQQRVYRGKINTPKTSNSSRVAALPSGVLGRLKQWREMAEQPDGLVFPSENGNRFGCATSSCAP